MPIIMVSGRTGMAQGAGAGAGAARGPSSTHPHFIVIVNNGQDPQKTRGEGKLQRSVAQLPSDLLGFCSKLAEITSNRRRLLWLIILKLFRILSRI